MNNLIILYDYHEAPPFLTGNPHIKSGYRGYLPLKLCLKSLFLLHNESINVWSHLVVGLYFFYQYYNDMTLVDNDHDNSSYDRVAFITMIIAIQICMFASATFHLFNCQSHDACHRLLTVDCVGIAIGLSGCFFPVLHFAFYCFAHLKLWYGLVIGVIFGTSGYFITRPWFGERKYTYIRILTYSMVAVSGLIPSGHWALLYGLHSEIVSIFLPRIFLLYFFGAFGAFFYVTRIPESLAPGRFDLIGSSHQVWHVCSALVFIAGHQTQQLLFQYVTSHPCPN